MRKKDLRTVDYVEHMLEAIRRIFEYTATLSWAQFEATSIVIDAVVRNFEVIGEAARNVMLEDPEFVAAHPEIPWQTVYGTRNRISHGYYAINTEVIWQTIQHDLHELQSALLQLKP
ncbi:HepT-like ribonuclease domain-containing protein [Paraburkholderia acidisoli]|uniref:DUF86 domain-containing protein n=1 Tax=Paraburkholderia acidisoli TaxID=2571748 RepID=A0A7Z2JFA2_9BURK|nr:DUF86 domain-containing protein [Paraburkholderia acidisoli]QGZ60935.1 DUF86 domain-containing protein [Paraburkholderia acidisoli]